MHQRSKVWSSFLLLATLAAILACNSSSSKDITARVGDPCQDCDQCCQIGSCCICDTCSQFAYDPINGELLVCNTGTLKWQVELECPGGGFARCENGSGQRTSCIGADGGQLVK